MIFEKKNEEILKLEHRNKVYRLISKYPGTHLRELERKSKIPYSTLKYHLHFLAKHSLILEKKERGNIKYYTKSIEKEDIEIISLLRQKNVRKIILLLLTNGSCSHKDFEEFTSLASSTVNWYLNNLMKKGIVEKLIIKNKTPYKLRCDKEKIMKVLITYKESFVDSLIDKTIEMWELR